MKKVLSVFLCVVFLASLVGCSGSIPEKPDTNLEFWIAENVDDTDFSKYREKYGIIGGREYYGTGYIPTKNENGEQVDPEKCVIYTVTAYPDYSSGKQHITRIAITDPSVYLYGLTVGSSESDISAAMKKNGFKLKEESAILTYVKGRFSISFTNECITVNADVSNKNGIQF